MNCWLQSAHVNVLSLVKRKPLLSAPGFRDLSSREYRGREWIVSAVLCTGRRPELFANHITVRAEINTLATSRFRGGGAGRATRSRTMQARRSAETWQGVHCDGPDTAPARQNEERMTKHSKRERAQRAAETENVQRITAAWVASVPPAVAREFALAVEAARARGPEERQPDMAPGTAPRPPRPGHEPRPPKEPARPRRAR